MSRFVDDKKDEYALVTPDQCTLEIMSERFVPYLCEFCSKSLKSRKLARDHEQVCGRGQKNTWYNILGKGLYECLTCQEVCRGKMPLKAHLAYTHNQTLPFYCDQCGDSFFTEGSLKFHYYSNHGENSKTRTRVASKNLDESGASEVSMIGMYHLKKHFTFIPKQQAIPIIDSYFSEKDLELECKICHQLNATKEDMRDHLLESHLKLLLHKCD